MGYGLVSKALFFADGFEAALLLMIRILHYPGDPKLWEQWYIPYYG